MVEFFFSLLYSQCFVKDVNNTTCISVECLKAASKKPKSNIISTQHINPKCMSSMHDLCDALSSRESWKRVTCAFALSELTFLKMKFHLNECYFSVLLER